MWFWSGDLVRFTLHSLSQVWFGLATWQCFRRDGDDVSAVGIERWIDHCLLPSNVLLMTSGWKYCLRWFAPKSRRFDRITSQTIQHFRKYISILPLTSFPFISQSIRVLASSFVSINSLISSILYQLYASLPQRYNANLCINGSLSK